MGEKIKGKGKHPNCLKALENGKFKKGHKANGGRPKGSLSYKERFRKYLELEVPFKLPNGKVENREILDGIILSALAQATKGDIRAMEFVFHRAFGKESEKVELTGKNGQPLAIEHGQRLRAAYERAAEVLGSRIPDTGLIKD